MPYIVLNEEQLQVVTRAGEAVEVRDPDGNVLTHILPIASQEDIAISKRRLASKQPRFTSQQVREHFQILEEAIRRDGLDAAQAKALLKALQAGEKG